MAPARKKRPSGSEKRSRKEGVEPRRRREKQRSERREERAKEKAVKLEGDQVPLSLSGKWERCSLVHKVLYLVYILPYLTVNVGFALLFAIPWKLSRSMRPSKPYMPGGGASIPWATKKSRTPWADLFAPVGYGVHHHQRRPEQRRITWVHGWLIRVFDMGTMLQSMFGALHWRNWLPFGILAKVDTEPRTDEEMDTFSAQWRKTSPLHRILFLFYMPPFLLLSAYLAAVFFLPWAFIQSTRPSINSGWRKDWKKGEKYKYSHKPDDSDVRCVLAPYGFGTYHRLRKASRDKGHEDWKGISRTKGFCVRVFHMYCLLADCWRMFERQGLQVVGVFCGSTLALMQMIRMGMELRGGPLQKYIEAKATGGGVEFLRAQPNCAYVPGTGFANWGGGWEPFAWYILYHGWVLLLCLLLIADEVLNVRMGLFAPQWSRGGTGYTIMFLALCILNSSPNWGWKVMIPAHHVLLLVILSLGAYNVIRLVLSALDCTPDRTIRRSNRRNGRFPLRPWTEDQWQTAWARGNFRTNQDLMHTIRTATTEAEKAAAEEAQRGLDRLYPIERFQAHIGDHVYESTDKDKLEDDMRDAGVVQDPGKQRVGRVDKKVVPDRETMVRARGKMSRKLIHWFPLTPPPQTSEDLYALARGEDSCYLTDEHHLDRFLIYLNAPTGRMAEPFSGMIAGKPCWLYADQEDIYEPTPKQYDHPNPPPKHFRWETKEEFALRQKRNKKEADSYYGNHYWSVSGKHAKKKKWRLWHRWFDIRRAISVFVGFWMLIVHILLLVNNLGTGSNNWPSYNAQYKDAAIKWRQNRGPLAEDCQYYQGSALPIWIRPGEGSIQGAMFFFAMWEFFIIHLCLGVIFVALSNNRTYGMHFTWPITLIGPRTSSVSIGMTLGFVGAATLQMGLFLYEPWSRGFAQGAGYCCLGTWALYLFRNERMRGDVTRHPFPPTVLSLWAHEYMDGKTVYKPVPGMD